MPTDLCKGCGSVVEYWEGEDGLLYPWCPEGCRYSDIGHPMLQPAPTAYTVEPR